MSQTPPRCRRLPFPSSVSFARSKATYTLGPVDVRYSNRLFRDNAATAVIAGVQIFNSSDLYSLVLP